jgi:hypothetical protein
MYCQCKIAVAICCMMLISLPSTAKAWNSPGHMIIALVAYDELSPAMRARALELLRAHPRFDDHFLRSMPAEVNRSDQSVQEQWLFSHAATWPDQVRDPKRGVNHQDVSLFNRPSWHYINEPFFLNENERRQLMPTIKANRRREVPEDTDDIYMNVVQALKNSAQIVRNKEAPAEKRAVHLCWIMHLAGDSHQPLHSIALFTTHRFRGGDRGGNDLEYEHGWALHSFWDEQISGDEAFETQRVLATDLQENRKLTAAARQAAGTVDPGAWIDESFELAQKFVYTKELLKKVADREGHSRLGPLDLPPTYRMHAEEVAERRALEAGHRLAAVIKELLK